MRTGSPDRSERVENCLIAGNTAPIGGGVSIHVGYASNPPKTLRNCTIVDNVATNRGGGVAATSSAMDNCILWANTAPQGAQLAIPSPTHTLFVRECDLQGGQAAVYLFPGGSLSWGPGNIDQDPLFVDADGLDDTPATFGDNDYRLVVGSPCIDAGSNLFVPADLLDLDGDSITNEPVPFDLDFLPRIIGARVDMGAYEQQR